MVSLITALTLLSALASCDGFKLLHTKIIKLDANPKNSYQIVIPQVNEAITGITNNLRPLQFSTQPLDGEDAAVFTLQQQSVRSWATFTAAVAAVLSFLFYVWVWDSGLQWGDQYLSFMEVLAGNDSTLVITYLLAFFAAAHSGLASLRPLGEQVIGERAWRVIFALVSLPLAFSSIVYFINHRYKEYCLTCIQSMPTNA